MLELNGKVAFVFGVASEDSIAWAICEKLAAAGVILYLGYQKRFMSRIFQLFIFPSDQNANGKNGPLKRCMRV